MLKRSEAKAKANEGEKLPPAEVESPKTVSAQAEAATHVPLPASAPPAPPSKFSAEGEEVTICYGIEKYSPVQYNSFEHGPFFVKVKVAPGETHLDAATRAWNAAATMAKATYVAKEQAYLERLKALGHKISG